MQRISLLLAGFAPAALWGQQGAGTELWRVAATTLSLPPALGTGGAAVFWNPAQPAIPERASLALEVIETAPTVGAVSITSNARLARSGIAGWAGFQNAAAPLVLRAGGRGSVVAATRQSSAPAPCWPHSAAGANPTRSSKMRCMANVHQLNYLQAFRTLGRTCACLSSCLPLASGYPLKPRIRRGYCGS